MKPSNTFEVADLLETFDKSEILKLIEDQLNTDQYTLEKITDHIQLLYVKWRSIMENPEIVEEIKVTADKKFKEICEDTIKLILNKFGMTIDDDWFDLHQNDVPALTMVLYHYFVLDFTSNIYDLIMNYIMTNYKLIYEVFESMEDKKDASTINQKKKLSSKMALIIANIYDISEWIIGQIDEKSYFNYADADYALTDIFRDYIDCGIITGSFMNQITKLYLTNISLKSEVCFTIISNAKIGVLVDPFKLNQ